MNTQLKDKTVEYLNYLIQIGETEMTLHAETWQALQKLEVPKSSFIKMEHAVEKASFATTAASPIKLSTYAPNLSISEKAKALQELAEALRSCPICAKLFQHKKKTIFGLGEPDADIVFVGEAIGLEEDELGEPFVGKAGQMLTKMITAMGLSRDQVYLTTLVKFRPDMPAGSKQDRKPTAEEIKASLPFLASQLNILKPKVIVCLGTTVLEALLNIDKATVAGLRGNFLDYEGVPLMPTFHPGYLLTHSSNEDKRAAWEDLLKVMKKVGLPISEKQQQFFLKK